MRKITIIPIIFAAISIFGCLVFSRHYLRVSAAQFAQNFEHENFEELSTADTYALATRLNALTKTIPWTCIIAKRGENIFFEKKAGICSESLARERVTVSSNSTSEISIEFTLELPHELNVAITVFAALQIVLLTSLVASTRSRERAKLSAEIKLAYLAAQVAHDIRSPLAALTMAEKEFIALPEDTRILVRSAISRIRDIANHLLDKNRSITKVEPFNNIELGKGVEKITTHLLPSLVEGMISEMRMEYRSRKGVEIDGRIDTAPYGLFADIQLTAFKRVLSNLVNNSVEALGDTGEVLISLFALSEKRVQLEIKDNGKGISSELLAKLGQRGETYGKLGGSGLGLYQARNSIEHWGGSLEIKSDKGHGTVVGITLPQASAPKWFLEELTLLPNSNLVVLDDDESIHRIWSGRAEAAKLDIYGIKLIHLSIPSGPHFVEAISMTTVSTRYLFDYEFFEFKESGLDLIEKLGIATQSILVTSRYEEPHIRERCERLRVPLIPKGMAGFVPIRVLASKLLPAKEEVDRV